MICDNFIFRQVEGFCYSFGIKSGVLIATVFSLLRCFIFGFFLNVIVLYLVYYNLFALFFGWLGMRLSRKISFWTTVTAVVSAVVFTVFFTLLDDIVTPLIFGFGLEAARVYFFASLYTVIPQTVCAALTVAVFFAPLTSVISKTGF